MAISQQLQERIALRKAQRNASPQPVPQPVPEPNAVATKPISDPLAARIGARRAEIANTGPIEVPALSRFGEKAIGIHDTDRQAFYERALAEKYPNREYTIEPDPDTVMGSNYLIKEPGMDTVQTDPQGLRENLHPKEIVQDVLDIAPAIGQGAIEVGARGAGLAGGAALGTLLTPIAPGVGTVGLGAAGEIMGGALAGAATEYGRQKIGQMVNPDAELDKAMIAVNAGMGLVPGVNRIAAKKIAEKITTPFKKGLAKKVYNLFSEGNAKIKSLEKEGIDDYFGIARKGLKKKTGDPLFEANKRITILAQEYKAAEGDMSIALQSMRDKIYAPLKKVRDGYSKTRNTQEFAWEKAVDEATKAGDVKLTKKLLARGAKGYHAEGVPRVPTVDMQSEKFLSEQSPWRTTRRNMPRELSDDVNQLNSAIKSGKAEIDDLLSIKANLNSNFNAAGQAGRKFTTQENAAVNETRDMIDGLIRDSGIVTESGVPVGKINQEYSAFSRAFPQKLIERAERPASKMATTAILSGAATAGPFAAAGGAGGFAIGGVPGMVAGATSMGLLGVVLRYTGTRPSTYIKMAQYAAKASEPEAALYFQMASQVGYKQAMQLWGQQYPGGVDKLMAVIPQLVATTIKSSASMKSDLRKAIMEDGEKSPMEKGALVDKLNEGRFSAEDFEL